MKRALVFSGGGSRGSYEIGAWQALDELGLRFHMCFGTSIGAINAALFLQGDCALAARLWDEIISTRAILADREQAFQVERMFGRRRELLPFLLEHARQLRMDISPLEALLRKHIDEGRVRASGMDFGLMTMRFPTLAPAARTLAEIPQGQLIDWVLASSACFPIFPTRQIDGDRYVDGGYCDNLPVDMAVRAGAEEVVAVELHPELTHPEYAKAPFLTAIVPRRSLGAFLDFDADVVRRNRLLGYYDVMKAYGRFDGVFYTFTRLNELRADRTGRRFMRAAAAFDAEAVRRAALRADKAVAPLISALEEGVREPRLSFKQVYLRSLEMAAAMLGFAEAAIYDAGELSARMAAMLEAEDVPAPERREDVEALARCAPRRALAALLRLLRERGAFPAEWADAMCAVPEPAAAALGLLFSAQA